MGAHGPSTPDHFGQAARSIPDWAASMHAIIAGVPFATQFLGHSSSRALRIAVFISSVASAGRLSMLNLVAWLHAFLHSASLTSGAFPGSVGVGTALGTVFPLAAAKTEVGSPLGWSDFSPEGLSAGGFAVTVSPVVVVPLPSAVATEGDVCLSALGGVLKAFLLQLGDRRRHTLTVAMVRTRISIPLRHFLTLLQRLSPGLCIHLYATHVFTMRI
jgi:hypothetical protein